MKITDIRVVSRGFHQDFPLVEVDTDAGITGIGATASWTRPVSTLLDSSPHDFDRKPPRRRTAGEMIAECVTYRERGFKAVKLGWGNHFSPEDEDTLAAVREGIGPEMLLMLDFGCPAYLDPGHTVDDAVRAAEVAARYGVHFLEEALRPRDVEGFAELTQRSPVPVATGESLALAADFREFIDRKAAHILQPDAQQIGITQFADVARRIEEAGLLYIPHCPWNPVAVAAHLQVMCTTSCGVRRFPLEEDSTYFERRFREELGNPLGARWTRLGRIDRDDVQREFERGERTAHSARKIHHPVEVGDA